MLQGWIIDHVKEHPPRCLAGLAVDYRCAAARAVLSGGEDSSPQVVTFALGPRTGDERPTLLGHYLGREWPDHCAPLVSGRILVSPLFLRWNPSGSLVPVFDHRKDGYNAEIGCPSSHEVSRNPLTEWVPPVECHSPVYVARLGYSICYDEDLLDNMRERPQDFFDVFSLVVYCQASERIWFVTEFECA
jgi:hypothetical protein